jgi:hypothetical protein
MVLIPVLFHISMEAIQGRDDTRTLARLEQQWISIFQRGDSAVLENVLTGDFIYTAETGTLGKKEFIALAKLFDPSKRGIELTDNQMRIYGRAAISTGVATLRSRDGGQIKGESKVASRSGVVNLDELSRQEKSPPTSVAPRIVPAPMPIPNNRPVPVADAKYRYTAIYVKLRGRWQMVALHLSQVNRE